MIAALAALAILATPRVLLSVDHPFLPDRPGAVVRVEVEGSHTLDVRLYELHDPERYLSSRTHADLDVRSRRNTPPGSTLPQALGRLRRDLRHRVAPLLTEPALQALHLLAPGSVFETSADLPLLQGEHLLRRWTLPCGGNQSHSYCDVDLGPLPAGAYLVEGIAAGEAAYAVALSTNLALTARRLPGQLLLYAADSQSGEPRPGVQIRVAGAGIAEQKGVTGPQGTLLLKPGGRQVTVSAHAGGNWALLDLDYFTRRGRGPRVWLDTDRGEVRPGEAVRVLGMERPPPLASRDLPLVLEDGRGSGVAAGVAYEDERGLFTGTLTIPVGAAEGLGHVVAEVGGRSIAGELWIRDPPPADLRVRVSLPDWSHALATLETLSGEATGARYEWHLLRTPLRRAWDLAPGDEPPPTEVVGGGEMAFTPEGAAAIPLPVLPPGDARYHLEATAIDTWGRRCLGEVDRTRLDGPVHLEIEPDRRVYSPGELAHIALVASDASGRPSAAAVVFRAFVSRVGPGGEPQRTALPDQPVAIPASGRTEVALPNLEPGYYELEARAGRTPLASGVLFVTAHGGDIPYTPDALTLVSDRTHYQPGDTARILVLAPFETATAVFTAESGEFLHQETVAIRGSSALTQVKLAAVPGVTFAASAIFASQAYQGEVAVRVGPAAPPLGLEVSLAAGARPGIEELTVRARDASGKPLAGVELLATWRDAAADRSLGPALGEFLEPPPAREGKSDVSLDFHRAGYSHGTPASRAAHAVAELGPAEGFTPQKGLSGASPRPLHSLAGGMERLPPTDRAGASHLSIGTRDARELRVRVVGVGPLEAGKLPSFGEASAAMASPWPVATPHLPSILRPGDEALAKLDLQSQLPAVLAINDSPVPLVAGKPITRTVPLNDIHPVVDGTENGDFCFRVVALEDSERTWETRAFGILQPGRPARLAPADIPGPWRLRFGTGLSGLLTMLDRSHFISTPSDFEQAAAAPGCAEADSELAAFGRALARRDDLADLSVASAALIARLAPDGSLAPTEIEEGDLERTATGLVLLDEERAQGVDVPTDWLDRTRSWVTAHLSRAGPGRGLGCWALGASAPEALLGTLLDADARGELAPLDSAALALTLESRHPPWAAAVASRLEHRAALASGLACWESGGCDPGDPASADAIAATALSVMALSHLQPKSPRLPQAIQFLLRSADRPGWATGVSGALVPRALAEHEDQFAERAASVSWGPSILGRVHLAPGGKAERFSNDAPGLARAEGGPVFFEAASAAPSEPPGEGQRLERRWYRVDDSENPPTRAPLEGSIELGGEVWTELSASGFPPGAVVRIEDYYPGGLVPFDQPTTRGPQATLQAAGGRIHFRLGRVQAEARADKLGEVTVGYLARAAVAGRYRVPPARAQSGDEARRSGAAELTIEDSP